MNGLNGDRFVTGTLTRPFSRQPQSLVPSPDRSQGESESSSLNRRLLAAAGADDSDSAWRHKQAEIRELQAANRSLLRRVYAEVPEVQKTPPHRPEDFSHDEAAATGATTVPSQVRTPLYLSHDVISSAAEEQAGLFTPSADETNQAGTATPSEGTLQAKQSPVASRIVERSSVMDQANTIEIRRLTSCVAKLEGHLNAQEEVLAAERARHKEDIQHLQSEAVEEKKRMRRENAKKVAELQARGEELTEEVQEANNKAKEAERTMHSRISSMRQSSQKLKNQLQAEQRNSAEMEESATKQEALEQSVAELQEELHGQEVAYAELHEELSQQQLIATEEREALLKELADLSADASQVKQQCHDLGHHKEEHETLLAKWQSHVSNEEECMQAQRQLEEQAAQSSSLLKEELLEAQKTATISSDRHQALLEEIRDERQAAALQLEELMQEARAKQRILQDLLSEGVVSTEEVQKIAAGEGESLQSWAAGLPSVSRRKATRRTQMVTDSVAQLKDELVEAKTNVKLRDELNEANVRLADQLTEANAKLREELIEVKVELHNVREGRGLHQEELEAEKQAFTQELQQLQRSIRSELAAQTISRYSSQASSVPSSSNLWEEHDQVLQDLRAAKKAEASARQDLEKQRIEMRKARQAHQIDMDALAAELQQFQEEHGHLEGKLRVKEEHEPALRARLQAAEARVLEESRIGRQQLQRLRQFQAREQDMELASEQSQELQQQLSAQLANMESKFLVTKEQLQKVREDKMTERLRFERQLEKLRGELNEQKSREANDKGKSPGGSARQSQEHVTIRNLRSMSKQLSMQLEASEERIEGLESTSECHANTLAEEEASAQKHRAALEERAQAAETWGKEMARRLQDAEDRHQRLQMEKEAHYRETHLNAKEALSAKLVQSIQLQVADILTLAGAAEVPHIDREASPEVLVTRCFAAVSQAIATLLRENTELRASNGMPSRNARHETQLVRADEAKVDEAAIRELQELRIQKQEWDLQKRRNGQAEQAEVYELKQRLKQVSQAKRRSDERVDEYQQELTRHRRQQQADLERAQLDMTAQHQQFQAEQEQLSSKLSAADRKTKMLEAKLKGRVESLRMVQAEKEAIEEQLRIAAKQLEALLADETKESDLQRDLAALSKQFEQLHGKHRVQLAKAEEHAKQLKHEQAARQALETRLADLAMAKRAVEGEAKAWQQQIEVLDKDLRASQAAEAVSSKELQRLQSMHGEDQRLIEELQHELRRLKEDLHEARRATPQELILRLKRMEEELQHTEAARQQLERRDRGSQSLKAPQMVELPSVAVDTQQPSPGPDDGEVDVRALKEIQETLAARERQLREAKAGQDLQRDGQNGGMEEQRLADLERDFAEFARSVGFTGDVSQLWEEAQAAAAKEAEEKAPQKPQARRDERPVAADIQLRPSADSADVPSPPRRGVPWKSTGAGVTPKEEESSTTSQSKGVLPLAAQECFQQAEALCARQRFSEAVPLFRRTLEILQDASGSVGAAAAAEVWAHLGVAMQSLDRVPEAIDSYRRAVAMDAGLHVCFANLATLHAYLHEKDQALEYIAKALEVEPGNPTYLALRSQFTEQGETHSSKTERSGSASQGDQSQSGESANEFASEFL